MNSDMNTRDLKQLTIAQLIRLLLKQDKKMDKLKSRLLTCLKTL